MKDIIRKNVGAVDTLINLKDEKRVDKNYSKNDEININLKIDFCLLFNVD